MGIFRPSGTSFDKGGFLVHHCTVVINNYGHPPNRKQRCCPIWGSVAGRQPFCRWRDISPVRGITLHAFRCAPLGRDDILTLPYVTPLTSQLPIFLFYPAKHRRHQTTRRKVRELKYPHSFRQNHSFSQNADNIYQTDIKYAK